MTQNRPNRQHRSQVFRWVVVVAYPVLVVVSLVGGEPLLASMWAVLGLSILVEATRLDERSAAGKRLGQILTAVFVGLAAVFLYTIVIS